MTTYFREKNFYFTQNEILDSFIYGISVYDRNYG